MKCRFILKPLTAILLIVLGAALMGWWLYEPACQRSLTPFNNGTSGYVNRFLAMPGVYTSYGLLAQDDINPNSLNVRVGRGWNNPALKHATPSIHLITVGDVIPHGGVQVTAALNGGYLSIMKSMQPTIQHADLAIANLETPIAKSAPCSGECFVFNASSALLRALKNVGFNVLETANNHSIDQTDQGYRETVQAIRDTGLLPIGFDRFNNKGQHIYNIVNVKGIKIGLLNYTLLSNKEPKDPALFNYVDEAHALPVITADLQRLKKQHPDYIILLMHWQKNREYHVLPSKSIHSLAHQLILNGADLIIGGHPHVIQPSEIVYTRNNALVPKGTPGATAHAIIYSLGNFISHQRGLAAYGMLLNITLAKQNGNVQLAALNPHIAYTQIKLDTKQMDEKTFTYVRYEIHEHPYLFYQDYLQGHHATPAPTNMS